MSDFLRDILQFIRREKLHRLFMIIIALILFGTVGLTYFEPQMAWYNASWWTIVTLTTVGYGDIAPTTFWGRFIGTVVMLFGIGILGLLTATIASVFVHNKLREDRGMSSFDFENHLILCEWNHRAREILRELRSVRQMAITPIVLIAKIDTRPVDDENLYLIQGSVNEETLLRANLSKADTVVILGERSLDENARDAQVVLAALTVESINPDAYSIVELVHESNVRHCERAHADEIIVGDEFSSRIIAQSTLNHGISKVLSELLSSRYGNDIVKLRVPQRLAGQRFIEVFTEMKKTQNSIVLAIQKPGGGAVISNPDVDLTVEEGDALIVVGNNRTEG